jgi:hypothetical protein
MLIARQHRAESLRHGCLARARYCGQIGVKRFTDLGVQPARTALGLIGLEQDARLEDYLCRNLAFGDKRVQPCAPLRVEFGSVFF